MVDSSWDNSGQGMPAKTGLPLWGKIGLGCGVAVLILMGTCVGGAAFVRHRLRQDPEGFKNKVVGFALDRLKPDWEDFRAVVEQLRTPAGCRTLYAASPELARTWPTEADFLAEAARWQQELAPLPELTPDLMEHHGLRINRDFNGKVTVGWSPRPGPAVYVTFDRARKRGDSAPRRVVDLDVRR